MSTTQTGEAPTEPQGGPRVTGAQVRDLSRLRRTSSTSPEKRYLAGVAGGIARHLDIDPVIVRVAFVITAFFGGAGLVVYAAGWLLLPRWNGGTAVIPLHSRSRSVVLWVAGGIAGLVLLGHLTSGVGIPWWTVAPLVVLILCLQGWARHTDNARSTDQDHAAETPPSAPARQPSTPPLPVTESWEQAAPGSSPRPRKRSDRGPILFWFTLGLIAVSEGALAVVDGAGASVSATAYAALALGVTGLMLVLGSIWGRAGGLILVGILAIAWLGVSAAADRWGGEDHQIRQTPTTAAAVQSSYQLGAGELLLDLSEVSDPAALDQRVIELTGDIGLLQVTLPAGMGARLTAKVGGVGEISLLGHDQSGVDLDASAGLSAAAGQPTVTIDASLSVGEIVIESEGA